MPVLKLIPACKNYIWGGTRLKDAYGIHSQDASIAEAWVLSCHPDGPSTIAEGAYAGKTLAEYIQAQGKSCLGSIPLLFEDFPILIKLIDAKNDLSIQVHPSNKYAMEHENQYGKTEMWYVLDAEPDASLYMGFSKDLSAEEFSAAIADHSLVDKLNKVSVKAGDVFYIPPGTIHAIGKGLLIAEVQQNSNVTYRVYDYGRLGADGKPRDLHIEKAKDVIKFEAHRQVYDFGAHLARCVYFTVDRMDGNFSDICDDESFTSLVVIDGAGEIICGTETVTFRKGDSLFLPAESGTYRVNGACSLLRTRVGTIS